MEKFESILQLDDPVSGNENIQQTVWDLKETKKSLKIYTGDAYWFIFDHPDILRVLKKLEEKGVVIQMTIGPVLSRGGGLESPEVTILAEEGAVDFYYRPKRGSFPDFFIIDDRVVLAEKEKHNTIPRMHLREIVKVYKRSSPEEFDRYASEFNSATEKVNFMKDPRKKCLILHSHEIRGVLELASQQGKNYDDLTRSEIRKLVKAFHAHEARVEKRFNEALAHSKFFSK